MHIELKRCVPQSDPYCTMKKEKSWKFINISKKVVGLVLILISPSNIIANSLKTMSSWQFLNYSNHRKVINSVKPLLDIKTCMLIE